MPGHRPLYLYAADCKSAETNTAETNAETPRNDRHGKHTLSQVGNPVPRSTGQYFAGSTRVLAAEYADALRTACPRFPQFAPPSSSAPSSFPVPSVRSVPPPVPSDLQSDGAKYKDFQSGKTFRFHKPSTRKHATANQEELVSPGHRPLYLHPADTFHRICNPMAINMRIYNPENTFRFHKPSTRKHATANKEELVSPGHRPLYLHPADTFHRICNPMALNIRICNPEKHSAFTSHQRENTRRHTKRNLFFPGHRPLYLYAADTFHRICNPMALNIRICNPEKHSAFTSHQRGNTRRHTKRNLFFPGHRPSYLYAADCKSAETKTGTDVNYCQTFSPFANAASA